MRNTKEETKNSKSTKEWKRSEGKNYGGGENKKFVDEDGIEKKLWEKIKN